VDQILDKDAAKEQIKVILEKYDETVKEGRVGRYNEEMTKKDFVLPLFDALGWNTVDSREVSAEERVSKQRVDYGFRINGIPKFFLETKSLKENLTIASLLTKLLIMHGIRVALGQFSLILKG
jgi:hypothetical protein